MIEFLNEVISLFFYLLVSKRQLQDKTLLILYVQNTSVSHSVHFWLAYIFVHKVWL